MKKIIFIIYIISYVSSVYCSLIPEWNQTYDMTTFDRALGITVDKQSNVYVCGHRTGTGNSSLLVIKYTSQGNSIWTQSITYNNESCSAQDIILDKNNDIYVAGNDGYYSTDPPGDCILWKIDNNGNSIWTQRYNSGECDGFYSVRIDPAGHIYASGVSGNWSTRRYMVICYSNNGQAFWTNYYNDGLNDLCFGFEFDGLGGYYLTGFVNYSTDPRWCTLRYDNNNQAIWTQEYEVSGLAYSDRAYGIDVDSLNNAYVVGHFDISPNQEASIIKYSSAGVNLWQRTYTNSSPNHVYKAVYIDHLDYIYTAGNDGTNQIVVKYNPDGDVIWVYQTNTGADNDYLEAVSVDTNGFVYIAGYSITGGDAVWGIEKCIQIPYPEPTTLVAAKVSNTNVILNWQDNAVNEAGYRIYRSENGTNYSIIDTVTNNIEQYENISLQSEKEYWYVIRAVNQAGESLPSNILNITTLSGSGSSGPEGSSSSDLNSDLLNLYTINDVIIVPNPYNPKSSIKDYITFYKVPSQAVISVYNIVGKEIANLSTPNVLGQIKWNIQDKDGNQLKRGMYIAHIKDQQGNTRTIKFVIHH